MSLSELREAAGSDLICNDVFEKIQPRMCAEARRTTGGPAKEKVQEQIAELRRFIK